MYIDFYNTTLTPFSCMTEEIHKLNINIKRIETNLEKVLNLFKVGSLSF